MSFHVQLNGATALIEVRGQLVVSNRRELRQKILEALEKGARKFLIDFRETGYIDSSGVSVLVHVWNRIQEQGGALWIANLNEDLRSLFELTRLDAVFEIADSREAALEDF